MDLLCKVCDRSIIENESEYYIYLASLRKNDKSLNKKYNIDNVNLDEVNRILNDCISTHKQFSFLFY